MKCLCFALCLVAVVAMAVAYPGFEQCKDSDDCGDIGCCVRPGGEYWSQMTKCKAYRTEGKACTPQGSKNGVYNHQCPCREDLECVGQIKASSDSDSSESDELEFYCRAKATSAPPEVSSAEPEPEEHSEEPEEHSEEPQPEPEVEVEEEKVEVAAPIA